MIKSYAKLNIFLKIVGKRGGYHEIISRFARLDDLYDEINFVPKEAKTASFDLVGDFDCELEKNSVYKAYKFLREFTGDKKIDDFFAVNRVEITKNIPKGGGLGGGSSNAAAILLALNRKLELKLSLENLCEIGGKIGADVNFFLYETASANVRGVGEIVEPFLDDLPRFKTIFTDEFCDTARVYKTFRERCWDSVDRDLAESMVEMSAKELLKNFSPFTLNDLLRSVLICYPNLKARADKGEFLSGSGSTFFEVKE